MFLTFKNSPKLEPQAKTHVETHFLSNEPIKMHKNKIEPIKMTYNWKEPNKSMKEMKWTD